MQRSTRAGALIVSAATATTAALLFANQAGAATYYTAAQVTTLSGVNSYPVDINASGVILGNRPGTQPVFEPNDPNRGKNYFRLVPAGSIENVPSAVASQMNDAGEIAAYTNSPERAVRSTATGAGTLTLNDLGLLPGFTSARGFGINASGQVTGSQINSSFTHAFRSTPSNQANALTDLGTIPGETNSRGGAINAAGQVAGDSGLHIFRSTDNASAVALTDLGAYQTVYPSPGFATGSAVVTGVNSSGQVIAYATTGSGQALLPVISSKNSESPALYYLPATLSLSNSARALDINDSGEVVGHSRVNTTDTGTYFHNGISRNLSNYVLTNMAGDNIVQASAINNAGVIAVTTSLPSQSSSFRLHTWLLTPSSYTNSLSLFTGGATKVSDGSSYFPTVTVTGGTSPVFNTPDDPTTGGVALTGTSSLGSNAMTVLLDLNNPTQSAISSMVPDVGQASFTILSDASTGPQLAQWNAIKNTYGVAWDAAVVYSTAPAVNTNFAWDFTADPTVSVNQLAIVPEPASIALLGAAAAAPILLNNRRRRRQTYFAA